MASAAKEIRALNLFCGAGGSSCGAAQAGATIVGGIDGWETAIDTFRLNFPSAATWKKQIQRLTGNAPIIPLPREIGATAWNKKRAAERRSS